MRLPHLNFDAEGRGAFSSRVPKLGDCFYGGLFRMPWFDLEEDGHSKNLPEELAGARKRLEKENRDFAGIDVCRDYGLSTSILAHSNRETTRDELIVVKSRVLSEIKGELPGDDLEIDWIGYDIVAISGWSLIEDGLFIAPSYFSRWVEDLNPQGLFSEASVLEEFVNDYQVAASKKGVEDIPPPAYGFDAIQVGRVR